MNLITKLEKNFNEYINKNIEMDMYTQKRNK